MFQPVYDILRRLRHGPQKKCFFFCLVCAVIPALPALFDGGLIGFEGAEAYGHAWAYWWRIEAFPLWPNGTELAHGTQTWPAIDPLPSLFCILIGQLVGPLWAYNLWLILSRFVLAVGGWLLAQNTGGRPLAGAFVASFFPPFLGVQYSGLTEDFALGLALIGFAFLLEPTRPSQIRGALSLALVPWCGLVLGWYTGLAALCLGFFLWFRAAQNDRREMAVLGVISAIIGALSALPHWVRLGGVGHRHGSFEYQYEPLWTLNPVKYVDIASLIVPYQHDFEGFILRVHPGYLGLGVLLAALIGSVNISKIWWFLCFIFVGIAIGPQLVWMGEPSGIDNPLFFLFNVIPGFSLMNHYGRALLIAGIPLVVLAARGAKHRSILGIVVLDLLFLAPLSPILPSADSKLSSALHALSALPPGDIVILPPSGPNIHPQKPLWEQRLHGRKVWLSPNRLGLPAALAAIPEIRQLAENPSQYSKNSETFPCFIAAVVVRDFFAGSYVSVLGEADFKDGQFSIWSRERLSPQTKCAIE